MILSDYCDDLVINRNNFDHIFIAGQIWSSGAFFAALHKSLDGGTSWTHKKLSTSVNSFGSAVAIHPSNDNVIYVGGSIADQPTVFKSTNGGSNWSNKTLTGGSYKVSALAVDPQTPGRLYAGTNWGLFRTENSGSSWTKKGDFGVNCLKINPSTPSIIYAGCRDGVYVSTDYGNTWKEFNEGLTIEDVIWLDIDKPNRILYAATEGGGVYKRIL
jgi:photosystem II stability/assembly factor-like uncharacterized protein